jgi:FkbM family methyltransferase
MENNISKKIFIDCGTHMFQGFNKFVEILKIDKDWKCYSFEANPITYNVSKNIYLDLINNGYDITHENVALSTTNGEVVINCQLLNENATGVGSNILFPPPPRDIIWGDFNYLDYKISVKSIDFIDFLKTVCSKDNYVAVKMDIEGSEFDILDKLMDEFDVSFINEIYVEFHERFFEDIEKYKEKKTKYINFFNENGVVFHEWE